jgi:hypothetical protein
MGGGKDSKIFMGNGNDRTVHEPVRLHDC